jgi:hypothetical protein
MIKAFTPRHIPDAIPAFNNPDQYALTVVGEAMAYSMSAGPNPDLCLIYRAAPLHRPRNGTFGAAPFPSR